MALESGKERMKKGTRKREPFRGRFCCRTQDQWRVENSAIAIASVRVNVRVVDVRRALRPRKETGSLCNSIWSTISVKSVGICKRRKRDCRVHTNVKRRAFSRKNSLSSEPCRKIFVSCDRQHNGRRIVCNRRFDLRGEISASDYHFDDLRLRERAIFGSFSEGTLWRYMWLGYNIPFRTDREFTSEKNNTRSIRHTSRLNFSQVNLTLGVSRTKILQIIQIFILEIPYTRS